jgi:glycosyltransferase involved in cell wall biosynthesis
MEILWICGSRRVGGSERVTLEIARRLTANGHRLSLLLARGSELAVAAAASGIETAEAPLGHSLDVRAVRAIERRLGERRTDAALVTTSDEWVWAALARRGRAALVLVRHMALPLPRRVQWLAGHRADAIVAVGPTVAKTLTAIDPRRLRVIANFSRFPPRGQVPDAEERARARESLRLTGGERWVGFFGGLDPAKGIDDLVAAVGGARRRLGDVRLLVCGGSDARTRLPDEDWIVALGSIDDVRRAMTAVDVVALATRSRLREGMPLVAIESLACGTAVVATATGGVSDVVGDDGVAGLLARADDPPDLERALSTVLDDAALRGRMAAAGLVRVRQRFDVERAATAYEELLAEVVARRPARQSGADPSGTRSRSDA